MLDNGRLCCRRWIMVDGPARLVEVGGPRFPAPFEAAADRPRAKRARARALAPGEAGPGYPQAGLAELRWAATRVAARRFTASTSVATNQLTASASTMGQQGCPTGLEWLARASMARVMRHGPERGPRHEPDSDQLEATATRACTILRAGMLSQSGSRDGVLSKPESRLRL
jgi:hypothetical protein